jgi:hypothetical protein
MFDEYNTIFISIASYRDDETPKTILSAFNKAKNPYRVFLGICQQNKESDIDCINNDLIKNKLNPILLKNILVNRIDYTEAKGPTFARYLCSLLYRGEKYYMQIDSHIQFAQNWDEICVNSINIIKNEGLSTKPVLSYYPKHYEKNTEVLDNDPENVPRICKSVINDRNMVTYNGAEILQKANLPTKSASIAAGTFFCEGYFLEEVPFDPELPDLFTGEEVLFSARMWTHGWDIFNFNKNVTYHYYTRAKDPKFWDDNKQQNDSNAFRKVKYILNLENTKLEDLDTSLRQNVNKYGLGKERTIQQFWDFCGINWDKKEINKDFCRNGIGEIVENFEINNNTFINVNIKYIIVFMILFMILFMIIFLIKFL